jgi:hypothetical protein
MKNKKKKVCYIILGLYFFVGGVEYGNIKMRLKVTNIKMAKQIDILFIFFLFFIAKYYPSMSK